MHPGVIYLMSLSPVFPVKWKLDLKDWLDYSKLFWQEYLIDVAMYFILHYMRGHVKSGCLILSMLRWITWLRGWQPHLSIVRLWVVIFCFSLEQVMCRWVYSANFDQVKSYSFWCSKLRPNFWPVGSLLNWFLCPFITSPLALENFLAFWHKMDQAYYIEYSLSQTWN